MYINTYMIIYTYIYKTFAIVRLFEGRVGRQERKRE
jgi:hypothetical protein